MNGTHMACFGAKIITRAKRVVVCCLSFVSPLHYAGMSEICKEPTTSFRNITRHAWNVFSGFCMGCADIVPGVSGGTMALLLGIYDEFIQTIRCLPRIALLQDVFHARWLSAWRRSNMGFLIAVGAGIATAVLTLSSYIERALIEHPAYVWSVFFGLVLASVAVVARRVERWRVVHGALLCAGAAAAYWIVGLVPVQTPDTWWFLVLSGAIAICAMILPGISGSFLLVLLGKYEYILRAVNQRDIGTVALVGIGAVIGILAFSQVLGWLLRRYHNLTMAALTGLMLGSLRRIWPWQETLTNTAAPPRNVLPVFMVDGIMQWETLAILGCMAAGMLTVLVLEKIADAREERSCIPCA